LANGRFPAEKEPLEIHLTGNPQKDDAQAFWRNEIEHLDHHFTTVLRPLLERKKIEHLSVFALAPIPLLAYLGSLLTDKVSSDIYQLHREPITWVWGEDFSPGYLVIPPVKNSAKEVALVLSLSGKISHDDVKRSLGDDVDIWEITIPKPDNNFLKSKQHLSEFRSIFRSVLNSIKEKHGTEVMLKIFPAVPVSAAIEIGRVWMPKADLPLLIYDRNRESLKFNPTVAIPTSRH
jgi:hypothetical protein